MSFLLCSGKQNSSSEQDSSHRWIICFSRMGTGTMRKTISLSNKAPDLRVPGNGVTSSHEVFGGHLEVLVQVCFPGFTLEISTSDDRILESRRTQS